MVGPSLHLVEFVSVSEHRNRDGAAVFVTSRGGPGKSMPTDQQNVAWERQWWAGVVLAAGRADHCWLPWHQDSYQICCVRRAGTGAEQREQTRVSVIGFPPSSSYAWGDGWHLSS